MAARRKAGSDPFAILAQPSLPSVLLVDGSERALVEDALKEIKAKVLAGGTADFNYDAFSAKDTPAARAVDAAQTLPAFAPLRLVIYSDADKLSADKSEPLLEYVKHPNPSSVLVVTGLKFDARTKLYKGIQKLSGVLRFEPPKLRAMPQALRALAEKNQILLDPSAVEAVVDAVGTDLSRGKQVLEFLQLYVGPDTDRKIRRSDVEDAVAVTRTESVFDLVDALGERKLDQALGLLERMLEPGKDHPLRILGMVARQYRNLAQARASLDLGNRADIAGELGLPPFLVNKLLSQAKRHSLPELVGAIREVSRADRAFKGGALSPRAAAERFLLRLMAS